ncbi:uncharacterized protein LY89DRAFT_739781 [Mollisia scopiformis]|uniref:Uncharacterized protein n=1 Tax=Mollisia scopiformis TaxID=149040 RepID=A0A194WS44_MOLSC|nr:uncharacterized protein LY89DRAFT_739781 [Mollisia scopiformis]KUJ10791.1 hypothetical protein LY89DRAFT_739781 [Mollisia scopiformis]
MENNLSILLAGRSKPTINAPTTNSWSIPLDHVQIHHILSMICTAIIILILLILIYFKLHSPIHQPLATESEWALLKEPYPTPRDECFVLSKENSFLMTENEILRRENDRLRNRLNNLEEKYEDNFRKLESAIAILQTVVQGEIYGGGERGRRVQEGSGSVWCVD